MGDMLYYYLHVGGPTYYSFCPKEAELLDILHYLWLPLLKDMTSHSPLSPSHGGRRLGGWRHRLAAELVSLDVEMCVSCVCGWS